MSTFLQLANEQYLLGDTTDLGIVVSKKIVNENKLSVIFRDVNNKSYHREVIFEEQLGSLHWTL